MTWFIRYRVFLWFFLVGTFASKAQLITIPDANLKAAIIEQYPLLIVTGQLDVMAASLITGTLDLSDREINNAEGIQYFAGISVLNLMNNEIESLPSLANLTALEVLNVSNNELAQLPSLQTMSLLQQLLCSGNNLETLPNFDGNPDLRQLIVTNNALVSLPTMSNLQVIEEVQVSHNALTLLPAFHAQAPLMILIADHNQIVEIPSFESTKSFDYLGLNDNALTFSEFYKLQDVFIVNGLFHNQNPLVTDPPTIQGIAGGEAIIVLHDDVPGSTYQWCLNGEPLVGEVDDTLYLSSLTVLDTGVYSCTVSNNLSTFWDTISISCGQQRLIVDPCLSSDELDFTIDFTCDQGHSLNVALQSVGGADEVKFLSLQSVQETLTLNWGSHYFEGIPVGAYDLIMTSVQVGCEHVYQEQLVFDEVDSCDTEPEIVIENDYVDETNELTPNGDGINDIYHFEQEGVVRVFNRHGELVKELSIPGDWDGSNYSGMPLTTGLYILEVNGEVNETVYIIR